LGFKDLISKNSADKIAEKYSRVIDIANSFNRDLLPNSKEPSLFTSKSKDERWCISKIFSDSIILVAHDGKEEACLRLLIYVWRLLQACLSAQMPFRGGVAYDEIFVDEIKEIFLGRALTKAYELEGSQEWIGTAIHEDFKKTYPNIFNDATRPYLKNIFLKYPVPFKGGGIKMLHTINWRFNLIVEEGTRSLMPYSLDRNVINKVQNTLKYSEKIVQSGEIYISDQSKAPIEVRSFYCGSKFPPFPHGDDL
ncbi:MAG: hypothetical protein V1882_09345, partial [Candidatus Omnitrophota bacterium]